MGEKQKRFWVFGIKNSAAEEPACQASRIMCFSDVLKQF